MANEKLIPATAQDPYKAPLIHGGNIRLVPDEFERTRYGLEVMPGTLAARAVGDAVEAVMQARVQAGKELTRDDNKLLTLGVRPLERKDWMVRRTSHQNRVMQEREAHKDDPDYTPRESRPERPITFSAGETAVVLDGLHRVALPESTRNEVEMGYRTESADRASQALAVLEQQALAQGANLSVLMDSGQPPQSTH